MIKCGCSWFIFAGGIWGTARIRIGAFGICGSGIGTARSGFGTLTRSSEGERFSWIGFISDSLSPPESNVGVKIDGTMGSSGSKGSGVRGVPFVSIWVPNENTLFNMRATHSVFVLLNMNISSASPNS